METYSHGDIVVYAEHDDLTKDITNSDIVEYLGVIEGYLPCNYKISERESSEMETRDEPCIAPSEMTRFCIPAFIGMAWRGEALVWIQSHVRYCAVFVCTVFGSS